MSAALAAPSLPARFSAAIDLLCRGSSQLAAELGQCRSRTVRLDPAEAAARAVRGLGRRRGDRAVLRVPPGHSGASRPRTGAAANRLPGGSGWLLRLAPALETRLGRAQVESLLDDPDLRALLAQAPQAGRILRPLCHMLGIETPAALHLPRRPRQRPHHSGGTEAGATGGDAPPARAARPLPSWLTRPASPPLPRREEAPAFAPPDPTRTGPPGT